MIEHIQENNLQKGGVMNTNHKAIILMVVTIVIIIVLLLGSVIFVIYQNRPHHPSVPINLGCPSGTIRVYSQNDFRLAYFTCAGIQTSHSGELLYESQVDQVQNPISDALIAALEDNSPTVANYFGSSETYCNALDINHPNGNLICEYEVMYQIRPLTPENVIDEIRWILSNLGY